MITIEDRSAFFVTVPKHSHLDRTFAYHRQKEFKAYLAELKTTAHKPVLSRGDSNYAVRVRALGHRDQCIKAKTYQEAIDIKDQMDLEHRKGLFIDYAKGRSVTFGDTEYDFMVLLRIRFDWIGSGRRTGASAAFWLSELCLYLVRSFGNYFWRARHK